MTPCLSQAITLCRGDNDPPVQWQFATEAGPESLIGLNFELDVRWTDIRSNRLSTELYGSLPTATTSPPDGLAIDYLTSTVSWPYSTEDSASIPPGAIATYKLRQITGTGASRKVRTRAQGRVLLDGCIP